jgi:PAS domain S-box-containing protein
MTGLTLLLLISIVIRGAALLWSIVLVNRYRDWRMATLTAMLVLSVARQVPAFVTHIQTGIVEPLSTHELAGEIPALLVSILTFAFVFVLDRSIASQKAENEQLRRAERKLRESEARLRLMLEQIPAVVWTTDKDLKFTSSLGAGLSNLGLEPGQVIGMSLHEYFGGGDEGFPALEAHRQALQGELIAFEQDWGGQSFHVMVEPLKSANDAITGTLGVALDISELVASERALRRSEERYRDFLAQTSEGIWRLELAQPMPLDLPEDEQIEHFYRYGFLAECSDAFAHMYGLAASNVLVGARLDEILPRSDSRNHKHLLTFVRRGYSLENAASTEKHDDGRERHYVNSLTGIVESESLRSSSAHPKAESSISTRQASSSWGMNARKT